MVRFVSLGLAMVTLAIPALAGSPTQSHESMSQRFYDEVVNKGNVAVVDELLAEDFVDHEPFPGLGTTREDVKKFFAMMRKTFPDLKCDVEFMMSDGDKVAVYFTMSGTQKEEFMGMPASGKKFSVHGVDIIRIADQKCVEHWGVTDALAMMQQLGAAPMAKKTK